MQQLKYDEILSLVAALKQAGWDYVQIEIGDLNLVVSNGQIEAPVAAKMANPNIRASRKSSEPLLESSIPNREDASSRSGTEPRSGPSTGQDEDGTKGSVQVTAPSIGTFWRSPQPGAPPFVDVGSVVKADQTLCIVEVMKMMIQVIAPAAGAIKQIHKQNGDMVEHGDVLFTIAAVQS